MKMQRLHLLAMEEERQSLMDALLQFGRLEIRQTEDLAADPDWAVLLHPEPAELVRWREASRQMEAALSALGSRGLKKTGLFAPRPQPLKRFFRNKISYSVENKGSHPNKSLERSSLHAYF